MLPLKIKIDFHFWTLIIAVISHTLQGTMYCWLKDIIVTYLLSEWSFTHSIQKVRSDLTKTDKTIHTLLWRHRSNPSGIWTKRRKKWGLITRLFKYLYPPSYLSNTYLGIFLWFYYCYITDDRTILKSHVNLYCLLLSCLFGQYTYYVVVN